MVSEQAQARKAKFNQEKLESGGANGVIGRKPQNELWYCTITNQVRIYGSRADFYPQEHWARAEVPDEDIAMFLINPELGRWLVQPDSSGQMRIVEREQPKFAKLLPQLTSLSDIPNADVVIRTNELDMVAHCGNADHLPLNGDVHIAICQKNDPYSIIFNVRFPLFQVKRNGEVKRGLPFEVDIKKYSLYAPLSDYTVCWEPL